MCGLLLRVAVLPLRREAYAARVAKCLALGATAAGLGRAALIAVDTDACSGLVNLVECLRLELQMLISALGKYHASALTAEDVWSPDGAFSGRQPAASREPAAVAG